MDKAGLRELLRQRRARLDPVDLGLLPDRGRRKKARGLSQAQVAQLLFRTERWYGEFERGGIETPTSAVLEDVARVLKMDESERTALFVFALAQDPPDPVGSDGDEVFSPRWSRLADDFSPLPVVVTDLAWNALAYNTAFSVLHDALTADDEDPGSSDRFNVIRWQLLRRESRNRQLLDWENSWAVSASLQLRYSLALHPANQQLQRLTAEVESDPEAGPIYRANVVRSVEPPSLLLPIKLSQWGSGSLEIHCMRPFYGYRRAWISLLKFTPDGSS
ncbi:helix-turn-helix domain-containing protein [Streptomyces mirabilis]|uniref:MmyB family transcriptional regulator n=1 Tax=Streptomyces mirabilis TaxID=68239 RepID=UPI0036585748